LEGHYNLLVFTTTTTQLASWIYFVQTHKITTTL